ncbi:hypothetical protein [Rubrivirga sp. IMCC43871]|uniref:hypothetical protein n=1 Tax=Rubrivirga sp. IMCC43871 TaxID=3391575 RepID=UPI00398FDFA2
MIRSLVQLIPFSVGSAVDVAIAGKIKSIREDRARTFFDQLASGEAEITTELVQSEDFLHSYFSTVSAALRSRRREKTALFANLLVGGVREASLDESDDYEELVAVMDSMSLREIESLFVIDSEETANARVASDDDLTWVRRHLPSVSDRLRDELGIPESETENFIQRLSRTGLVEKVTLGNETVMSATISVGWGAFRVTSRYKRLKALIQSGRHAA